MNANETTINNILNGLKSGNAVEVLQAHTVPDFKWRIVGEHTRELDSFGVYIGIEGLASLQRKIAGYATDYKLTSIESIVADEKLGMSVHRSSAVSDGEPFDTEEVYVWHFQADGRVTEIWDYNRIIHNQMVELGERGRTGY